MERYGVLFKKHVLNFKLELCCFMATVRTGVLALACINIAIGTLTLMFFAEGSFEPLLLQALASMASDPPNYGPSCMIAYAVELGSNVLLLCAMIRDDLVLLRAYMYYAIGVVTASVMVYSVMFGSQTGVVKCLIITSIGYQIYIILLVRSVMVEIKQTAEKNRYTVKYRQSIVRYSRPGSFDKYSVLIEPQKPRRSLVPVVKEMTTLPKITKEDKEGSVKKADVTVHPAAEEEAKRDILKEAAAKEAEEKAHKKGMAKEEKEEIAKKDTAKEAKEEVLKKGMTKEKKGISKKETTKDAKKYVAKDAIEHEPAKRKRSFFGRKEKVKKDESSTTTKSEI